MLKKDKNGSRCTAFVQGEFKMQSNNILDLVEKISSIIPNGTNELKDDIKDNIKLILEDYLKKLDLVTREEFDIQKEVLLKTRLKIEELEKNLED